MTIAAIVVSIALQQAPPAPAQTAPPPCAVSEDATYAFTRENPVQRIVLIGSIR